MDENLFRLFNELDDTPRSRSRDVLRAPFGYPGSKTRSLKHILPLLPYSRSYIEPFGGSGSVLIARRPSKLEVFNDRYAGVVAFYRCIREKEKCDRLIERINLTLHSREEFEFCRETWRDCTDDVERAARWYYMVQSSFATKGQAFGRSVAGDPCVGRKLKNNLQFFEPIHRRLCLVQIENQDWRNCLKDYDNSEAVFYLDPPFIAVTAGIYEHTMTIHDHEEMCHRIFTMNAFVAVSGYLNPETKAVYDKYNWNECHHWEIYGSMQGIAFTETNHLADYKDDVQRKHVIEALWIKESS